MIPLVRATIVAGGEPVAGSAEVLVEGAFACAFAGAVQSQAVTDWQPAVAKAAGLPMPPFVLDGPQGPMPEVAAGTPVPVVPVDCAEAAMVAENGSATTCSAPREGADPAWRDPSGEERGAEGALPGWVADAFPVRIAAGLRQETGFRVAEAEAVQVDGIGREGAADGPVPVAGSGSRDGRFEARAGAVFAQPDAKAGQFAALDRPGQRDADDRMGLPVSAPSDAEGERDGPVASAAAEVGEGDHPDPIGVGRGAIWSGDIGISKRPVAEVGPERVARLGGRSPVASSFAEVLPDAVPEVPLHPEGEASSTNGTQGKLPRAVWPEGEASSANGTQGKLPRAVWPEPQVAGEGRSSVAIGPEAGEASVPRFSEAFQTIQPVGREAAEPYSQPSAAPGRGAAVSPESGPPPIPPQDESSGAVERVLFGAAEDRVQVQPMQHHASAPRIVHPLPDLPPGVSAVLVAQAHIRSEGPVLVTLNPEELGTLRFEMRANGEALHITLVVERPETLDLLRRHSEQLASEFRQAGFAGASFSFSGFGAGSGASAGGQDRAAPAPYAPPDARGAADETVAPRKQRGAGAGLDLRL